jgi:acetate---CoA ligase (ADP-forming)
VFILYDGAMLIDQPDEALPEGSLPGGSLPEGSLTGAELARLLFNPRSVALIGASDDVAKTAGRPLHYLRLAGFGGTLYPINPRRTEVLGERCWPTLSSLPEVPEHVFILTPTASVLESVRECAQVGVRLVTILASGFSEAGEAGAALEAQLLAIAADATVSGAAHGRDGQQIPTKLRIVGPSSLGIVNPANGLMLTANAAFAEPEFPRGNLFVASQSGSMIGALVSRGKAKGIGFAGLISVGGEVDLSVGEICSATLDDPAIEGYLLFLENLRHAAKLRAFALEAARRGKPVIAYKLGRSRAAAEMNATHTGALAGEDDIADAFLRDCGIIRVAFLESLLECFPLAQRVRRAKTLAQSNRATQVGFVTTTGGGAAMVVDQLGMRDITVQLPSEDTMARVRAAGINAASGRVLDLTLAGARYEIMKAALDIYLNAPEFDLVVAVVGSSARFSPQLAVKPIIDSAGHPKPLVAMLVPEATEANLALTAVGVPCFRTPEACGDSIAATLVRRRISIEAEHLPEQPKPPSGGAAARCLNEAQAYQVLAHLGVPHAPFITLPLPMTLDTQALASPHSAGSPYKVELPFDYPIAAKVCSEQIAHKTEVGGVILNLANATELQQALVRLRGNLNERAAHLQVDLALLQPMRTGLAEVLIGYQLDAQVGPIILLAAGGIWTEIAADRSIRLAPIDLTTAHEMISEVRMLKIVQGLRGKPKGDLDALAAALCALSQIALQPQLGILDAEINPMMILPEGEGVLAVDALIAVSGATQLGVSR